MWNFNSYWVCFLFTLSIFLMCLMFIMWWMITLEQVLWKTQPVPQTGRILDLHGVWLVKKRKDTPGWSLHLPSSLALQKTELSLPVTALCSSWIRYLHKTAHTQNWQLLIYYTPTCLDALVTRTIYRLTKLITDTHLMHPLLAMTSAWLSLSTSPKWMNQEKNIGTNAVFHTRQKSL